MVTVKFIVRQKDHLVLTLVCTIQFMLGTTCLTVNMSNFLAMLFRQLLTLALVGLTIHVTHFLLPIGMQKPTCVSMHNIFQSNLRITARSSLNWSSTNIHHNLRIIVRNSLSCPPAGIRRNLRVVSCSSLSCPPTGICRNMCITAHSSLSCLPIGICRILLFRLNSMPISGKTVSANTRVFQRGFLFLFVHWFNEGCCVEGGEIGEEVRYVGKVTRETHL